MVLISCTSLRPDAGPRRSDPMRRQRREPWAREMRLKAAENISSTGINTAPGTVHQEPLHTMVLQNSTTLFRPPEAMSTRRFSLSRVRPEDGEEDDEEKREDSSRLIYPTSPFPRWLAHVGLRPV